ncbi:hypothetical protein Q31a_05580 [Aureliella helgolandensis]|uniref:Uncharacterized protein n=1 Tax=Aureliella helgolandensis TaxID=2527968 RepID=A0A518G167_9BACT|nr:hypothetical protein Q31a_05580 [Aureliella helgolandensis]
MQSPEKLVRGYYSVSGLCRVPKSLGGRMPLWGGVALSSPARLSEDAHPCESTGESSAANWQLFFQD